MGGLENYLKNFMVKNVKFSNGVTYEQALKSELKRFWGILENNFQIAYYSYYPKVYKRTGRILNSFLPRDEIKIDMIGNKLQVELVITDNTWHDSMFDGWSSANTILLYNYGYKVNSGWHKDIEYFGYREGTYFIEKSIEEFESTSKYGVKVNLELPNEWYY